ncbi:Myb/SANT-like DNA-binding domain [Popillia japonica]|uniref:Regulatory protein zeste n=1 Tax=Popillia japonica TaxID=7064 RepID=A0AAW1KMQ0_POPJA
MAQHFDSIENKKTDGATIKQKNQAWEQVAKAFNAATVNGARTLLQLKNSYNNIKRKLKNGATIKQKNQAWEQVAKAFNAATVNGARTLLQLKNSYNNIKRKLKNENADEKVSMNKNTQNGY